MKFSRRFIKGFLGVLVTLLFTLTLISMFCVAFVWISSKNPNSLFATHPTDEQLFNNFTRHQNEFDRLANMLTSENRLLVIFPDSRNCQVSDQKLVSAADDPQCLQYVEIFKNLGIGWSYSGEEPLYLNVSSVGLSVSGSTKGYYYSSHGPPSYGVIVNDAETESVYDQFVFKHLEGNWYIFIYH